MLRLVLLGSLIPLGVGVLCAMELRAPSPNAVAIVRPPAEPGADVFDAHEALAKADRLDVAAVSSETPERAVSIDKGIALPEDSTIGSSQPPKPIAPHRHNPKSKKVITAARLRPEPKAAVKRAAISQRAKAASDTEPCRLKAFGGLLKALNSADCEM
jgi:hypothetical protein